MRGVTWVNLRHHQILRLPRKMTLMIDPHHIWNVTYNARSSTCHPPTSPNTARATQNDSPKFPTNFWKTAETSFTMRDRSEHDPSRIRPWNRQSATRLATEVTFRAIHEHFVLKNTTFRAPAIIPNFIEYCACHEKWHFNFTKYCACHEKYHSSLILFTHETLFTMRGVTWVNLRHDQMLHLPRKMTLMIDPHHIWNVIYNARSNKCHCPNSPNTAPATKNDTWTSRNIAPATKNDLTEHWAMTWLSYDLTELWLDWAMTWLSYDLTELWLDWAITWLSYYLTERLLDWAMTWLSYDLTELLSCDLMRISEVSQLNFLW